MKIDVIIATYMRPESLNNCLSGLKSQTRLPDHVIVVTRPEDIESKKCLRFFLGLPVSNVDVTIHGIVNAENTGLKESSGDIVCFIDDDGVAEPHWLEKIEKHYQNPVIGGVGGPVIRMVNNKPVMKYVKTWRKKYWFGLNVSNSECIPFSLQKVPSLRGCNMSFRRETMSLFDTNLEGYCQRFEDEECFNILQKGKTILCDPEILVYHYQAPTRTIIDRNPLDKVYAISSEQNHVYIHLKHYPWYLVIPFLLFTFVVGDRHNPGLIFLICYFLYKRKYFIISKQLPWVMQGKIKGIVTYFMQKM